jgi:acyl carrier protein
MFKKEEKIPESRKQEILARFKPLLAKQLGIEEERIIPSASFAEDLGVDSLDSVEIIMALEEKFNIEIPDEDAEKAITVNDAIVYLAARIKQ